MADSDDDVPALSADTLAALQSFYKEQAEQQQQLETAVQTGDVTAINMQEDWVIRNSGFHYFSQTTVIDIFGVSYCFV